MKMINKILFSAAMGTILLGSFSSCSDFEDMNINPSAAGQEDIHPDYPLNKSFYEAQMDPYIAERVFVYNWASMTRVVGENTMGVSARYSDEFNYAMYNYSANWIKNATQAIKLSEENVAKNEHEKLFFPNVKQFARIWRCMLIADFTDCFGPYPLNGFEGATPVFNEEKDVYYFLLSELKDAAAKIDTKVKPNDKEAKGDPAFAYDPVRWQKLANSLRLRYAMRLSEVDREKAKAEFEDAARGALLSEDNDLFGFQENGGWSAFEGNYNRSWSDHTISSTMCNLLAGLGDIPVTDYRPDLRDHVKPMKYIGQKFANHFPVTTDNPTKQLWMDGIPEYLDPRALVVWALTDDTAATNMPNQGAQGIKNHNAHGMLNPANPKDTLVHVDAALTWNGFPAGTRSAWCSKTFKFNDVAGNPWDTTPMLGKEYRDNSHKRIWMSPWETYFLLAEGAVYGWASPMTAKQAYENGVKSSFRYFGVERYADKYLASTNYNRVGTSANFDDTTEPTAFEADCKDGYTGAPMKVTYNYPDPSKILYKGHKLNDQLTKIITQKYIANVPYGLMEIWNDRRRLGLPFFEIPANEDALTGSDMEGLFTTDSWQNGQKWYHFVQKMRYPSKLESTDKAEFNHALKMLNAKSNNMMTPLWWAIH